MVEKESHSRGLIPSGVLSEGHQLPNFAEFELMAFFLSPKSPSKTLSRKKLVKIEIYFVIYLFTIIVF
ncbi:MAG: hypothetical protein JRI87_12310 [Deltaproteobacteria bacterium]|nr:hypothetical protein [Deltaproteobacteria bacterium]